jgi:hypothetical protein
VRSIFVVVGNVRLNHPAEMGLIDRDHVVEAVSAETGNPSFGKSVLPRRSKTCTYLFEPKPINSIPKLCPIDLVIVCALPRRTISAGRNPARRTVAPAGSTRSGPGGDKWAEALREKALSEGQRSVRAAACSER